MKLLLFGNHLNGHDPNESVFTEYEKVNIEDMCLLFASAYEEMGKDTIRFVFGAHDEDMNMVYFASFFKFDENNPEDVRNVQTLQRSGLYFGGEYDNLFTYSTNFFLMSNQGNGLVTDFTTQYNEETDRYEFLASERSEDSISIKQYCIRRCVLTGIQFMYKSIIVGDFSMSTLTEVNAWLSMTGNRTAADYDTVNSIEIGDITKSMKESKGVYSGVIGLRLNLTKENGSTYNMKATMSYTRSKPFRNGSKTTKLTLMSKEYSNGYIIENCGGCPISRDSTDNYMIAVKDSKFVVLNICDSVYESFLNDINDM